MDGPLVPGGFSCLLEQDNYNSSWKKLLGFRNLQEKLEKYIFINLLKCSINNT